ncbi:PIN domain-containing protein [Candidatus Woesearchaeota archaeon]|nr:PIN domain-containing protein [Candidatus Woesearchaeota archaeon]MBI2575297.1 PIN domain-containing protein [Candidatus Woesearchaeota archaeon]
MAYFFDTYAVVEIIKGNPAYKNHIATGFVFTQLNLIELHYTFLRDLTEEIADSVMGKYSANVVPISNAVIKKANRFRFANRKKDFSTADAIGYLFAKENGMIFVTGDRQFEGMENVELLR